MSFMALAQLLFDVVAVSLLVGVFFRLGRPAKDDPRLSKGLQLLQSKISVLEDLSDRTEVQVKQLTTILEQKVKEIQAQIQDAEKQISKIEMSTTKSLEVAKIFQDRIPHQEIIERQNTAKYVKAARMAHQGSSIEEIASAVDLSRGEIEFIAKVNRDQLMFNEDALPDWAREEGAGLADSDSDGISIDFSSAFEVPRVENNNLKKLGDEFRRAVQDMKESPPTTSVASVATAPTQSKPTTAPAVTGTTQQATATQATNSQTQATTIIEQNGKKMVVRPLVFPKIDSIDNLGKLLT